MSGGLVGGVGAGEGKVGCLVANDLPELVQGRCLGDAELATGLGERREGRVDIRRVGMGRVHPIGTPMVRMAAAVAAGSRENALMGPGSSRLTLATIACKRATSSDSARATRT